MALRSYGIPPSQATSTGACFDRVIILSANLVCRNSYIAQFPRVYSCMKMPPKIAAQRFAFSGSKVWAVTAPWGSSTSVGLHWFVSGIENNHNAVHTTQRYNCMVITTSTSFNHLPFSLCNPIYRRFIQDIYYIPHTHVYTLSVIIKWILDYLFQGKI
jgi:hypothetical protein